MRRRQDTVRRLRVSHGAIDEIELPQRPADVVVGVPAAATEQARLEALRAHPFGLAAHAGGRVAARRPRMRRARPVRVETEWRAGRRRARAIEPALLVLAERGVRRPHQRDHVEAARAAALQLVEALPRVVTERLLEMAADDRGGGGKPTVAYWRGLRDPISVAPSSASSRRPD